MQWQHSESTVKPAKADDTLSKRYTYIRKNITETTRTDQEGNETIFYEYDEALIPKEDYYEISACLEGTQGKTSDLEDRVDNNDLVLDDLLTNIIPEIMGAKEE